MQYYLRLLALAVLLALFGTAMPATTATAQSCNPAVQQCG
jgi:hypothetical protein